MSTTFEKIQIAILLVLAGTVGMAQAAEVPGMEKSVLIKTREQPVQRFITELFGRINVPVVVAPEITGTVNGDFNGSVESVFDKLSRTFYVSLYYDGVMAHVYPANQSERRYVKLSPAVAKRVAANAQQLGLPNLANTLSTTDAGLVVTGSERFRKQIAELTEALNTKAKVRPVVVEEMGDSFRMFKLRYAWAHDVVMEVGGQKITVPGVASTLRSLIDPGSVSGANEVDRQSLGNTVPGLKGSGLQAVGRGTSAESGAQPIQFGDSPASSSSTRIVADSLNNAVLIRDKAERLDTYQQLIDTLDVEPKMVEIEATIIDMNTDRLRELGINWRAQLEDGKALFGSSGSSDIETQSGSGQGAFAGEGGILSLVLGNEARFISRIRALEKQGAARIVSKPHVMTLSNVEALLDTTSTFFVRVEGQEEVDLFNVSVGTTLRVTPHVFDSDEGSRIKLLVAIEDGSTSDQRVDNIPVIESSSINTQALVNVGESLLIGGLVREFNSNSISKVPLLGNIPVLGALFRSNQKTSSRVERMFLITPRLNLRPGGETPARLSVPYLAGSENEIIVSGPQRTEATEQSLALRDEFYGVPQPLPESGSDVTLSPAQNSVGSEGAMTSTTTPTTFDPENSGWQIVGAPDEKKIIRPSNAVADSQLPPVNDNVAIVKTGGSVGSLTSRLGLESRQPSADKLQPAKENFDQWQTLAQ